jgi:hypothetical protein
MATPEVKPWVMPEVMKLPLIISHPSPSDRDAIEDTLHRMVIGLDTNDPEMFDSALAEDAKWELHTRTLESRKEIHEQSYDVDIINLDTTHYVSSIRIHMTDDGAGASVSAMYEAHHYRGGRGTIPGAARYSTGGIYFLRLIKLENEPGKWRISFSKMKPIWTEGDRLLVMQH